MKAFVSFVLILIGVVMLGMCTVSNHAFEAMKAGRYPDAECLVGLVAGLVTLLYGIRVGTTPEPW